ncbi:MAG: RsmE family RNA methyltransferase, partial [Verrucomicrobia bacterium]|nr:RsmE family RNA methyltransferase [Verrucomicrobiota bacterium]
MPDFRAYCPPAAAERNELTLSPDESHHLVAVNRARTGDTVVVFDGRGTEWVSTLVSDRKHAAVLKVLSTRRSAPLPFAITLGQALPKGTSMDAIVRKATEIGAAQIVPLESE